MPKYIYTSLQMSNRPQNHPTIYCLNNLLQLDVRMRTTSLTSRVYSPLHWWR